MTTIISDKNLSFYQAIEHTDGDLIINDNKNYTLFKLKKANSITIGKNCNVSLPSIENVKNILFADNTSKLTGGLFPYNINYKDYTIDSLKDFDVVKNGRLSLLIETTLHPEDSDIKLNHYKQLISIIDKEYIIQDVIYSSKNDTELLVDNFDMVVYNHEFMDLLNNNKLLDIKHVIEGSKIYLIHDVYQKDDVEVSIQSEFKASDLYNLKNNIEPKYDKFFKISNDDFSYSFIKNYWNNETYSETEAIKSFKELYKIRNKRR